MICMTDVYSRETMNMFFVSQVSGLVENLNIGILSDTRNVINIKLCIMMMLFTCSYHLK